MLEPDVANLEAMVAEAEAKSRELRRATARPRDDYPVLRASGESASSIVTDALALSDASRADLDRIRQEHASELRRRAEDSKNAAINGSGAASKRLDALVGAEPAARDLDVSDEWGNPWLPFWPSVLFVRSSLGGTLVDSHLEDSASWAKWQCTAELSGDTEKVSFFHLWQNPKRRWKLADISVRLTPLGHFECSAGGWGFPGGFWSESRTEATVSAHLSVWPLWLPHDESHAPQDSVELERLVATARYFDDSEQAAISQSVLVQTARYAVPPEGWILIEASIALDPGGSAEVDFASGGFRIGCPLCFLTLPTATNP
jgi:hypothetical protein